MNRRTGGFRLFRRLLGGLALMVVAGCATTDELQVQAQLPQEVYISPANRDGVQDTVSIPASMLPIERTILKGYRVTVTDQLGVVVYDESASVERVRRFFFFDRNRRVAAQLPDIILWSGIDRNGTLVADGSYSLQLEVWDNRDNRAASQPQIIVVDNTPPSVALSTTVGRFSPDGDGRVDTVTVFLSAGTRETSGWQGRFLDSGGTGVRTLTFEQTPNDVVWDGRDDAGGTVADGSYAFEISATDEAGNSFIGRLEGVIVDTLPRGVTLEIDRRVFSPNGDGRFDTLTLLPRFDDTAELTSWRIEIRDYRGQTIRSYAEGSPGAPIIFDGKDTSGSSLGDGAYRGVLFAEYSAGQSVEVPSALFTIDTRPPRAIAWSNRTVFSPDGDGRRDTVTFVQTTSREVAWGAVIQDSAGREIRRYEFEGAATDVEWDGRDEAGEPVEDGEYFYRIESVDEAGNPSEPVTTSVRLDNRPTPVRIIPSVSRFSPNGDGLFDSVRIALDPVLREGIEAWRVLVTDTEGVEVATVAEGAGTVPASVDWNGTLSGGAVSEGAFRLTFLVEYEKGNLGTAESGPLSIDISAPRIALSIDPERFSPDGDGRNDILSLRIDIDDASPIEAWEVEIFDPRGERFHLLRGTGRPGSIRWNGRNSQGELVQSLTNYAVTATARDIVWNRGSREATLPVDVLILEEGGNRRITLSSIHFPPFSADYMRVSPEQVAENLAVIDRLAEVLQEQAAAGIVIEGHAVSLLWANPQSAASEQNQTLIPLSRQRAEAIRGALISRGIAANRMSVQAYGGSRPVVPHGDAVNRWKNRRVEFLLTP